jgi:hypothetical protein
MRSYSRDVAETEVNLGGIVGAVAARARAMTPEFDPGGFLEGLSAAPPTSSPPTLRPAAGRSPVSLILRITAVSAGRTLAPRLEEE